MKRLAITHIDERFKEGEYPSKEYPSNGFIIHRKTTSNFSSNENFVCLLTINALLSKGYEAKHIILEPTFKVGHNQQVYGDILILDQEFKNLILIENKTAGNEFSKEWNTMLQNGGQLFSYYAVNKTPFLCLLSYDFNENDASLHYKSHIITMKDNRKHLDLINSSLKEENKKLGFDDPKNSNAKDYYRIWNESYSLAYTTKGLLEEDIQSYKIGKEKYTLKDLKVVSHNEISSIYHDFATILRTNAIGNYENTFYILVDLFLCKIVDELYHQEDLQFYYKGVGYDDPFAYCDRLLNLYEKGIGELFKKDVVNITKEKIEKIFTQTQRKKGKLKEEIEKIFNIQKYFNIKKFNFLEVENEEEFHLNFKILIQIVNLIQDFNISQSENNQFLGDLFEGFLNRSIHQTEGRFFTPTPITNFIIHSLPNLAKDCKVLDFACGAGHFLTEFITYNKNAKLFGIEKNKELTKVATTACIIHSYQNKAKVIFQDALDCIKDIYQNDFKKQDFDLILSNPPYSVKGFLSNLEESILNTYELSLGIDEKSYDKNSSIECFFMERAKYFLKDDGIFALVLPVSILQKDRIYKKTRELFLKNFQTLAIAELNKRTFGSTGTQTIILFAKKIQKLSDITKSLKEENYNDEFLEKEYQQGDFLKQYCDFMGYDYEAYKDFMQTNTLQESLLNTQSFKSYFDDFNAPKPKIFKKEKLKPKEIQTLFEKSSFFEAQNQKERLKHFKQSKEYKILEEELLKEKFLSAIKSLEDEKMLYFSLIQKEKLILIKSPQDKTTDNKSNKANIIKFLGYDWSKRKGDEGIKYLTDKQKSQENTEKDEEILDNINSVNFINTPLYNPSNPNDSTKLSFAIKSHIQNKENLNQILEQLQPQEKNSYSISLVALKDMIDFSKANFDKAISLNPKIQRKQILSKFEIVRLETCGQFFMGGTPSKKNPQYWNGEIKWLTIGDYTNYQIITDTKEKITKKGFQESNAKMISKGAVVVSIYATIGKVGILGEDMTTNQAIVSILPNKDFVNKYLMYVIDFYKFQLFDEVITTSQQNVNLNILQNMQIPKPPLEIQKQIVEEYERLGEAHNTIEASIKQYQKLIKAILIKCKICQNTDELGEFDNIDELINAILLNLQNLQARLNENFLYHYEDFESGESSNESRANPLVWHHEPPLGGEELLFKSLVAHRVSSPSIKAEADKLSDPHEEAIYQHNAKKSPLSSFEKKQIQNQILEELQKLLKTLPTPPSEGWESVKLGETAEVIAGQSPESKFYNEYKKGLLFFQGKKDFGNKFLNNSQIYTSQITKESIKNDILMSVRAPVGDVNINPFEKIYIGRGLAAIRSKDYKFLFICIHHNKHLFVGSQGMAFESITMQDLKDTKITLPPLNAQEQIVSVIENIEHKISKIDKELEILENQKAFILNKNLNADNERERERERERDEAKLKLILSQIAFLLSQKAFWQNAINLALQKCGIKQDFLSTLSTLLKTLPTPPKEGWERAKLTNKQLFSLSIGKRVLDSELLSQGKIPVYSANVKKPFGFVDKELLKDYEDDSVLWGIDGDWLVGFVPKNTPFYPTDHCGVLRAKQAKAKLIAYSLDEEGTKAGFSRNLRASIERISALSVVYPPLKAQKQIISIIETIALQTSGLETHLHSLARQKQHCLKRHLFTE